tara:strand:- start:2045 stop:2461 length:417 start_codon:yes stop_codon:yes gene_type:complete
LSNDISEKDKKAWEKFIAGDDKIPDKELTSSNLKSFKIRSIDLHGYTLEKANKTIEKFINNSFKEKLNKLIVVTGKGLHSQNIKNPYVSKDLSILKYSVPEFILKNRNLMSKIIEIKQADINDGGSGAFYIFLKRNDK